MIGTYGAVILLGLALLRRSEELANVTLGIIALLAIIAIVVFLTGGAAEELVEELPGVSEPAIERHEEVSLLATIALAVLGAVSLGVLIRSWRAGTQSFRVLALVLVLSLVPAGLMTWTANLGGQIRHTEIQCGGEPER